MSTEILRLATEYTLYTGCITFSFGVIGNFLNILVFTQLRHFRYNNYAFYLTVESIANLLYQFQSISLTVLTSIYGDDATGRSFTWCKLRVAISQTFVLTTAYSICLAAVDQFFSTNYNAYLRQLCTLELARCMTSMLVCLWIIHSAISGLFYDVLPSQGCLVSHPVFLRYSTYFFYPVFSSSLPITIAMVFGFFAFRNVRRIVRRQLPVMRRRLDRQMTAMVLTRVVQQACFITPYISYRIYIINSPLSRDRPMEFAIGRLMQAVFLSFIALNYAISFYIYILLFSRFRRQLKYVLTKKLWQRWTFFCLAPNRVTHANEESFNRNTEID